MASIKLKCPSCDTTNDIAYPVPSQIHCFECGQITKAESWFSTSIRMQHSIALPHLVVCPTCNTVSENLPGGALCPKCTTKDMSDATVDPSDGINETLKERQKTHGDFVENGRIMQALKNMARSGQNWKDLQPYQREAIDMIQHKIGRILSGDPNEPDHWRDIAGYATLVEKNLCQTKNQ